MRYHQATPEKPHHLRRTGPTPKSLAERQDSLLGARLRVSLRGKSQAWFFHLVSPENSSVSSIKKCPLCLQPRLQLVQGITESKPHGLSPSVSRDYCHRR